MARQINLALMRQAAAMVKEYQEAPSSSNLAKLRDAIAILEESLQVYSRQNAVGTWLITMHTLATAYELQPAGDREQNLRKAITCFEEVANAWAAEGLWAHRANELLSLGGLYLRLPSTAHCPENVERALSYCEEALQALSETEHPSMWAMAMVNLGGINMTLGEGFNNTGYYERAAAYFEGALRVINEQNGGHLFAHVTSNLEHCRAKINALRKRH